MTTSVPVDLKLLERAQRLCGEKTRKATVARALEEFIARRERKSLLDLMGTLDWEDDSDYKKDRIRT